MIINPYTVSHVIPILLGLVGLKFLFLLYQFSKLRKADIYTSSYTQHRSFRGVYEGYVYEECEERIEELSYTKPTPMCIAPRVSRYLTALHTFRSYSNAYSTLGCSSSASGQEIKQYYRQLVQHWHPDRIAGRGASTEELLHTTEILQIINAAYETALRGVA